MSNLVDGASQRTTPNAVVRFQSKHYFLEWDWAVIQVENTMFRISRQPLLNLSQTLSALMIPGSSEINPIVLEDLEATEFEVFLSVAYPTRSLVDLLAPDEKKDNSKTMDAWVTILKVSTKFRCYRPRRRAILVLERRWKQGKEPTPTEMVQMGRNFWIEEWLVDGYKSLVTRKQTISEKEMLEIGAVKAFRLMQLREESKDKLDSGWDIDAAIRRVFHVEIAVITAEHKRCESDQVSTSS